jgi:hypothetical protein
MGMRSLVLALVAALPLAGGEVSQPVHTIPFTVHANGVYLSVSVNGSRPLQFQLDSAAAVHVINWNRAVELKLAMDESGAVRATGGGSGSARAAMVRDASFRIGNFTLPEGRTAAVNLDGVTERKGFLLDGLVGADLLKRYVVEVDTGSGLIKLYDPTTWKYTGSGERLAVRVDGAGQPFVRAALVVGDGAPMEGEFLIDSGAAEATVMLTSAFAEKHNVLEAIRRSGEKLFADEMTGVGGAARIWTARIGEMRLGKHVFRRPVIDISGAKGGTLAKAELAGIMGGEFLHRFRVIYDCPHNALYLEPTGRVEVAFEREMAGLRWLLSGEKLNQFRVASVIPDSPASRAGVQPGDRLGSVDGKPAASFDKQSLAEYLRRAGQRVTLSFTRDGKEIGVTIVLERLV